MDKKISVIIPVYNVEKYISRCLKSILDNTYQNLEIICIDDGSTDGSNNILTEIAILDNRVQIIKKENGGVSSARNIGLSKCTGDFVTFIDSDDWIHPSFFEILIKIQLEYNADIVITDLITASTQKDYEDIQAEQLHTRELNLEQIYANHTTKSYVTGRLFSADILKGFTFPENATVLEDAIFNTLVMCSKPLKITYTPISLYYYFSCPTSLTHHINALDLLNIGNIYFKYTLEQDNEQTKKIFTIETIKRMLFARYAISLSPNVKANAVECNITLKKATQLLKLLKNVTWREKLKYSILYKIPQLYRLFRIISDPTMLDWEKNQK